VKLEVFPHALLIVTVALAGCDSKPAAPAPAAASVSAAASASAAASPSTVTSAPAAAPRSAAGRGVDELLALRSYRGLTLSRDGARIAYTTTIDPGNGPARRSVFVLDRRTPSAPAQRVSAAPDKAIEDRSSDFSPDGKSLALLSTAENNKDFQLYIVALTGAPAPRRIGHVDGINWAPRFSPDGRSIALFHVAQPAVDPAAPVVSSAGAPPQRIAIIDVDTGALHFASPPDLHVYEYDWSPDGRTIAAIASPAAAHPDFYVARLYALDASSAAARLVFAPPRQLGDPRFSPDGHQISFISGLMSDEGSTGGDLFVVPAAGGAAKSLTPKRRATVTAARWRSDSRALLVDEIVDGHAAVSSIPADGGAGEVLFEAEAAIRGFTVSADGETVAFLHHTFDAAQSIWSGSPRAPAQIETTRQSFVKPWGEVKSLHTPSDTRSIQSFLIAPPTVEPGRKYPLITLVHGGPAWSWTPAPFDYGTLAAGGYYLLLPNPRGSFGLGEEFQEANLKDFGQGDLRDIRAGVRAALAAAPIDPDRVGIAGWSYGGFMAMWAVTQTNEFRAAVAGAGIANWQSYYGQNDIPGWVPLYFGATAYDDPAAYARSSPITFVKQARTPTLMIVGEKDTDCPPPQSRELFQALKTLGVPTEMVVYPDEAHGFDKPEHRRDRVERMLEWFNRYMPSR
jgi:dipeptidyl aminopeptidase/acylaminoacyl peptidase